MKGQLKKMQCTESKPVSYELQLGEQSLRLNEFLGHHLHFNFTGRIFCIQCGRQTKKSFQQGYCFPCYRRLNECHLCMIHPERCRYDPKLCSPDDWVHANCLSPHIVYLANSSGLKVGITRETQVPTRWIDQGAVQAIPLFSTENRYQAGILEVAFKQYVADKTNWRAMLSEHPVALDLLAERDALVRQAASAIDKVKAQFPENDIQFLKASDTHEFYYPVMEYPEKVRSFNFDKNAMVSGHLLGIKGQYLIFDHGVINIRKFGGYEVSFSEGCSGH